LGYEDLNDHEELRHDPLLGLLVGKRELEAWRGASLLASLIAAELRYGTATKGSPRLAAQLAAVLSVLEVLPFEARADATYGLLRARLEQKGKTDWRE